MDAGTSISFLYHTTPFRSFTPWSSQKPGNVIVFHPLGTYVTSYQGIALFVPLSRVDCCCCLGKPPPVVLLRLLIYAVSLFFCTVAIIDAKSFKPSSLVHASRGI